MNEFLVEEEQLGDLQSVTIGHDNTGRHPSWHLNHLTVTDCKTGRTYVFACRSATCIYPDIFYTAYHAWKYLHNYQPVRSRAEVVQMGDDKSINNRLSGVNLIMIMGPV